METGEGSELNMMLKSKEGREWRGKEGSEEWGDIRVGGPYLYLPGPYAWRRDTQPTHPSGLETPILNMLYFGRALTGLVCVLHSGSICPGDTLIDS